MDKQYLPTTSDSENIRARFISDQQAHNAYAHHQPAPGIQLSQGHGQPGGNTNLDSNHSNHRLRSDYVGWGGQKIPESSNFRVPWFGRNRAKGSHVRPKPGGRGGKAERAELGPLAGRSLAPGREGQESLTVEDMLSLIQNLADSEPIPERIYLSLYCFDSRAVSLLLKDLSKVHIGHRAVELFDYLRQLGPAHGLAALCDVYTYTAMISMCISQQNADRAMELMEDMSVRSVEQNVHTYTALMNVCIKCGKLPMALNVYNAMRTADCTPNVVTFNTLIDVHGKLGQWEQAAQVLQMMKSENVQPVLRTYNTLIIACNMCNQPREALTIFFKMRAEGFSPNSTTYNALISAYGKIGQLDKVLEVYQEMVMKNCERSVITYSSLISACEKAGRWELALKLFDDMQRDGCMPNTVTYNSLITACAQGAQWEKASHVFEQMQSQGCSPDVVTYTALISAFERGGQWTKALQSFHQMCSRGCRPDAIVYNAIIDALWETGVTWAQQKALQLYRTSLEQGHFKQQAISRSQGRVELNLHAMTAGVAMLSLYCWLLDLRSCVESSGESGLPLLLSIVTDKGKASKEQGNYVVKEAVAALMGFWEAPFRLVQDLGHGGVLEADSSRVALWVSSDAFEAQLACLFPGSEPSKEAAFTTDDVALNREAQMSKHCAHAFSMVQQFEATHNLALQNMGANYLQLRNSLVEQVLQQGSALGVKDEVVHDAVLIMDRTVSSTDQVHDALLPLVCTSALSIAVKQGEAADRLPEEEDFARVADCTPLAITKMEYNIRHVLSEDTQAISTLRCLNLYLERLGNSLLAPHSQHSLSGLALFLVTTTLFDSSFLNCRPSVIAAAVLYAERRVRGCVPFWPSMLAKLTRYEDMGTPELTMAIRSAQKLCRKPQFAAMYRERACVLARLARPEMPTAQPLPMQAGMPPGMWLQPAGSLELKVQASRNWSSMRDTMAHVDSDLQPPPPPPPPPPPRSERFSAVRFDGGPQMTAHDFSAEMKLMVPPPPMPGYGGGGSLSAWGVQPPPGLGRHSIDQMPYLPRQPPHASLTAQMVVQQSGLYAMGEDRSTVANASGLYSQLSM